jgi:uncharacterized protein
MFPTLVNTAAVLIGSLIGLSFHGRLSSRFKRILFQAIGLSVAIIGMKEALKTQDVPFLAFSMILGGLVGEWINIEEQLKCLGNRCKSLFNQENDSTFTEGFVYASLLFCVGALTVVGTFQAGVNGNGDLLYTKSVLDGHVAIFLAGAMGVGVALSAGTILLVQGTLTLLFMAFGAGLPEPVLTEVSAAGGLLIMGIALNLLEIAEIKVGNLMPGMLFAGMFIWIKTLL